MLVYKFRSLGFSTHTMHMHSKFTKFGRKFDKKMDYFGFKKGGKVTCHFQDRLLIALLRHLYKVHFVNFVDYLQKRPLQKEPNYINWFQQIGTESSQY